MKKTFKLSILLIAIAFLSISCHYETDKRGKLSKSKSGSVSNNGTSCNFDQYINGIKVLSNQGDFTVYKGKDDDHCRVSFYVPNSNTKPTPDDGTVRMISATSDIYLTGEPYNVSFDDDFTGELHFYGEISAEIPYNPKFHISGWMKEVGWDQGHSFYNINAEITFSIEGNDYRLEIK